MNHGISCERTGRSPGRIVFKSYPLTVSITPQTGGLMFHTSSFCQSDGCVSVGQFATSSYCNSDGCVAVGQFAKSSFSGSVNCLEAGQWDRFIDRVKQGVNLNFASYQPGDVMVWHHAGSDQWFLCRSGEGVELVFDKGEWDAFVEGVMANEFDTID